MKKLLFSIFSLVLILSLAPLKANDIVTLFFRAHSALGPNSNVTAVDLKCRVS